MEKLFLLLLLGLALIDAHDIHEPDEDKRTAQCRSFSDPNIITFDESYYQFHLEGDHFILFDDLKDTRVTVGYEKSGASSTRNCAVYVKKGRRLVFVDFCAPASPLLAASKLYGVWVQKNRVGLDSIRESPQCVPMSASDEDSERAWTHVPKYLGNFKCARVQAGSSYDTYVIRTYEHRFDETVKVRVQMSGRQLVDVRVEAPATSFNNTGGLCGKWDESAARELFVLDRDGVEHYVDHSSPDDLQLIGEFWKLHSRYNKDAEETKRKRCPECYVMAERSFYCPCDDFDLFDITNYNIEKPDRETYCKVPMGMCLHKYLERNTTCYAPTTTSILTTTTSAGESATSQSWVQTTANDIDDETTEEAFAGTTTQPSQTTGQPDHSEEGELIDHTEEEEGTVTPSSGTTTTKTPGISRPQAAEMCTYAILQNPTIEYFIVNGYLNVDFNVDVCINDAVASQDEDVTDSHVAFIKDEIISLLLDGSLNVTFADISDEIIAGLCPKDCNQNGDCRLDAQCLDSVSEECLSPVKCYCEEPYGGRDCSQDLTQIAPLTLDRTCCDLRHEHCSYVTGSGCSYETDDTIYVKIELIEVGVDSTNTIVKYTTADRHSIQQLGIHVIGLSELALFANIHGLETDFQAVESTAQLNIYISYLNSSFGSTYASITLYDSLCRECDQQNGATDVLPDRCDIDGVCRKRNDTQPDNVELVCEPDVDRFNWTYRPTPDPLCPNGYYWSTANLDDPSGDGDLELYGLFGSRYGCREPLVTIIETASDHTPYNETGQVLHVEDCYGFMCLNRENTEPCLDYQIRRCCPIVGTTSEQPEETTAVEPEATTAVEPEATTAVEPETTAELLTSAYPTTTTTEKKLPIDCYELWLDGERDNGYYQIQPEHHRHGIHVYCDMEDGGWTVVLNRIPDDEHEHLDEKNEPHYFFDRDLDEYKSGFGEARRNFWLGLRPLHSILAQSSRTELRVSVGNRRIGERVSNSNNKNEGHGHHHTHHAYYSRFTLADAHDDYEIRLGEKYAGELVDVSQPMSGRVFSTRDHDLTDNDCPEENRSGWWFDDESCWAKGMCLTCKHRHYYNGNDHRNHPSNYDDYEYIQMAIKSLRSA